VSTVLSLKTFGEQKYQELTTRRFVWSVNVTFVPDEFAGISFDCRRIFPRIFNPLMLILKRFKSAAVALM
jgi:hypothetical protein